MTDQGPRSLLPGQGMLLRARPAPYGMTAGVRSVLPGINDHSVTAWNRYPTPDAIDLDAPNQPDPGVAPAPDVHTEMPAHQGYELTDPDGNVIRIRSDAHKKRDTDEVTALGQALANHAVSPEEKETAARATEWGMAQVGRADIGDITKQMTHVWDMGSANANKVQLQGIRSKANRGGVGGVPAGPSKQEKFEYGLDKDLNDRVSQVLQQERQSAKYTALSDLDNTLGQMESKLNSGNSMAERIAVQQELLALTGKASRESEQAAITGSAGKWEELKNKLSLWTSADPNLSRAYVAKFKGMLQAERQALRKQKEQLGIQAATRMREQGAAYGPDQAGRAADVVYGTITGNFRGGAYTPPAAAPAAGAEPTDPNADLYGP